MRANAEKCTAPTSGQAAGPRLVDWLWGVGPAQASLVTVIFTIK